MGNSSSISTAFCFGRTAAVLQTERQRTHHRFLRRSESYLVHRVAAHKDGIDDGIALIFSAGLQYNRDLFETEKNARAMTAV